MNASIAQPAQLFPRCPPILNDRMVPKTPSAQVKRLANFPELLHVPVDGQGRSRLEALTLARLMFVRHGCVPDGAREELSGG